LALLCLGTKDATHAATHARQAVDLDAAAPRAWAVLAEALVATGPPDEAMVAVERAHAMAPTDAHVTALRDRIMKSAEQQRSSWIDKLLRR
jgi:Tfp pilus assembly protein PilF